MVNPKLLLPSPSFCRHTRTILEDSPSRPPVVRMGREGRGDRSGRGEGRVEGGGGGGVKGGERGREGVDHRCA